MWLHVKILRRIAATAAGVYAVAGVSFTGATSHLPSSVWLQGLSSDALDKVSAGVAVVEVLPVRNGDLAVFGAARVRVNGERLVSWMRQIDRVQTGRQVPIGRRFSDPPALEDLRGLTLDDADLEDIRRAGRAIVV